MSKQHQINITNGKGNLDLVNGNYTVSAEILGYDSASILPKTQEIKEGVNDYEFTVAATGTLTLHVTDTGTDSGNPIEGATFYRCDSTGKEYGNIITTNIDGNAVFNYVPFSTEGNAPTIYYKQIDSDGTHVFNAEIQNTTLDGETKVIEVLNSKAPARQFTLTDANYDGLPVESGNVTLTSN